MGTAGSARLPTSVVREHEVSRFHPSVAGISATRPCTGWRHRIGSRVGPELPIAPTTRIGKAPRVFHHERERLQRARDVDGVGRRRVCLSTIRSWPSLRRQGRRGRCRGIRPCRSGSGRIAKNGFQSVFRLAWGNHLPPFVALHFGEREAVRDSQCRAVLCGDGQADEDDAGSKRKDCRCIGTSLASSIECAI